MNFEEISSLIEKGESATECADYTSAANSYRLVADILEEGSIRYRCAQSRTLISSEQYQEAEKISDIILQFSPENAEAWYLKGSALFNMKKRTEAKVAFRKAYDFESELTLKTSYQDWIARCDQPDEIEATHPYGLDETSKQDIDAQDKNASVVPRNNMRMNWYQSGSYVNIDIYAKNVVKAESNVSFSTSQVLAKLKLPDVDDYTFELELFDAIDPDQSSWSVSRMKVELRLKKARTGMTWKALDSESQFVSAAIEAGAFSRRRMDETRDRQKQWDSFAEKELKDYNEDDSSMALFRTLYKDADEDTRRAMMKSYTESGGQVLSTNWDEVKKKKVVYEGDDK